MPNQRLKRVGLLVGQFTSSQCCNFPFIFIFFPLFCIYLKIRQIRHFTWSKGMEEQALLQFRWAPEKVWRYISNISERLGTKVHNLKRNATLKFKFKDVLHYMWDALYKKTTSRRYSKFNERGIIKWYDQWPTSSHEEDIH